MMYYKLLTLTHCDALNGRWRQSYNRTRPPVHRAPQLTLQQWRHDEHFKNSVKHTKRLRSKAIMNCWEIWKLLNDNDISLARYIYTDHLLLVITWTNFHWNVTTFWSLPTRLIYLSLSFSPQIEKLATWGGQLGSGLISTAMQSAYASAQQIVFLKLVLCDVWCWLNRQCVSCGNVRHNRSVSVADFVSHPVVDAWKAPQHKLLRFTFDRSVSG